MNKETHAIPITLVLPRYEVMAIIQALKECAEVRGMNSALADKIFKTTREQFVTFESQNERKPTNI